MLIKVKKLHENAEIIKTDVGDWIDISIPRSVVVHRFNEARIPLGIAMELPECYEAILEPRSSTLHKWGLIGITGVIDNSYCGDNDEWMFSCYPTRTLEIPAGTRLCQFRIQKKQPDIEFADVESLGNKNRGGFGSTGE